MKSVPDVHVNTTTIGAQSPEFIGERAIVFTSIGAVDESN